MENNRNKNIIMFEIFTILLFLFNIFFLKINNYYAISGILIALIIILIKFLKVGFEKRDFRYLKDVLLIVANFSLVYILIYYFSGLFFGFLKSGYSLKLNIILKNILPIIFIIISSELLRYTINNKIKNNIKLLILSILIFMLIDINLNIYLYNFNNSIDYIYLLVNCILPSLFKNTLLTYVSLRAGYKPNILYRSILEIPMYLIPIVPDMPTYIFILLNILFNWSLCMYLVKIYTKSKVESPRQRKRYVIPSIIMSILMIVIVYLCSGLFTYSIVAVGSSSMEKEIYKGDAIILKKEDLSKIKDKDILVFEKNNKKIIHRIVKIDKENETYYIKTKGDNNKEIDNWTVTNDEIIGIVKLKIKYIGYPTVWISELMR